MLKVLVATPERGRMNMALISGILHRHARLARGTSERRSLGSAVARVTAGRRPVAAVQRRHRQGTGAVLITVARHPVAAARRRRRRDTGVALVTEVRCQV